MYGQKITCCNSVDEASPACEVLLSKSAESARVNYIYQEVASEQGLAVRRLERAQPGEDLPCAKRRACVRALLVVFWKKPGWRMFAWPGQLRLIFVARPGAAGGH